MPLACKHLCQYFHQQPHYKTLVSNMYASGITEEWNNVQNDLRGDACVQEIRTYEGRLQMAQDLSQVVDYCELFPQKLPAVVHLLEHCIRRDWRRKRTGRVLCGAEAIRMIMFSTTGYHQQTKILEPSAIRSILLLLSSGDLSLQSAGSQLAVQHAHTLIASQSSLMADGKVLRILQPIVNICRRSVLDLSAHQYIRIAAPSTQFFFQVFSFKPEFYETMSADLVRILLQNFEAVRDVLKLHNENSMVDPLMTSSALLHWTCKLIGGISSLHQDILTLWQELSPFLMLFASTNWEPEGIIADFFRHAARGQKKKSIDVISRIVDEASANNSRHPKASIILLSAATMIITDNVHSSRNSLRLHSRHLITKVLLLLHQPAKHVPSDFRDCEIHAGLKDEVFLFMATYCYHLRYSCYILEVKVIILKHCKECLNEWVTLVDKKTLLSSGKSGKMWRSLSDSLRNTEPFFENHRDHPAYVLSEDFLPTELLSATPTQDLIEMHYSGVTVNYPDSLSDGDIPETEEKPISPLEERKERFIILSD